LNIFPSFSFRSMDESYAWHVRRSCRSYWRTSHNI